MIPFGVSPAFVVSRHGTGFSVRDYCDALVAAHRLGFTCFQPEIYVASAVAAWADGGAREVQRVAADLGLHASQFVAHFLLEHFATPERLAAPTEPDTFHRVIAAAKAFAGCRVLTVPLAPFRVENAGPASPDFYHEQWRRLVDRIHACLALTSAADLDLALEILPFSLVGNADGFLRLASEIGSPRLGINLDTGHAWATREVMELLPAKLAGRIFGLHLKDHNSDQNRPLAPGRGTIPWAPFLRALPAAGYRGSLDLEIGCPAEAVDSEYTAGRRHLQSQLHL